MYIVCIFIFIYICMYRCSCRSGTSSLSRQSIRSGSSTVNADKASPDIVLAEGMSVFVNKEMGIVKFIGKTDFSEGIWLGVELRKPGKKWFVMIDELERESLFAMHERLFYIRVCGMCQSFLGVQVLAIRNWK